LTQTAYFTQHYQKIQQKSHFSQQECNEHFSHQEESHQESLEKKLCKVVQFKAQQMEIFY